jgi:hypothetical protein
LSVRLSFFLLGIALFVFLFLRLLRRSFESSSFLNDVVDRSGTGAEESRRAPMMHQKILQIRYYRTQN